MSGRIGRARETLARAATRWGEHSARMPVRWDERPEAVVQARYTANCLRELDGFLRVLLDEIAPVPGPARRNTANKLDAMMDAGRAPAGGAPIRLRALGRSSACLFHCGGWVRRADVAAGAWMTAGWPDAAGPELRRYWLGERLQPGADEVASVCGFYLRLGATIE